ncbi:uncharacterized protein LOC126735889 [Anthonomus grandis grandis]|uniref:uncharacterized protein LOC126735889 n=1 Tax=Anthonomus grandis grandis TaxID=2921223 RepID=UPI002165FCD8|nr:uncharacterized protein LOC126735889 [Anthonomus grandis grandis]XP_050295949.1 uncharacterized protein LOC126735889 [Anthonomus grandis grandis]XP_050295950.1 uncharacterized protein LOC126735889 [Anthonomus grandis grandis]
MTTKSTMSDSEDDCSDNTSGVADWPVTEEWLLAVLKEHHKDLSESAAITIIEFTVKPGCETGECVLSDILAVIVTYCIRGDPEGANHNLNFIIKLLPQDPFSRFFVTEAQFDLREIKFYTQVVPDLEIFKNQVCQEDSETDLILPIPKCYYAHYSPGETEPEPIPPSSVLVLENIKPNGYQSVDFSTGLDLRQAKAAMEAIAKVHALSLCLKVTEGQVLSEKYPFLFQTSQASDSYQQLVERGLPQLFEFLESKDELKDILNMLNDLRPHTKEIIESLLGAEEPMALITHTDFWCNNLMFKENQGNCQCAILDWQMVTYSRPTNDLALLLVSSVSADLRREHTDELLDVYWVKLVENCKKLKVDIEEMLNYDRKKLGEDFRKGQLLALLLCIGSVDLALGNAQMEERLVALLKDLYKEDLLSIAVARNEQK